MQTCIAQQCLVINTFPETKMGSLARLSAPKAVSWKAAPAWFKISHLRQCLIYDSTKPNARLIGVEYMISPRLFETLPSEERKLWHTHEFEVKSGMLIMPAPAGVPKPAWEAAETSEMREVILLYGKTYHFWQADRGDPLPLGAPQLMASFTSEDKVKLVQPKGLDGLLAGRDEAFGVDYKVKAEKRKDIEPPNLSPDADTMV
ncbi:DUF1264 domain protein [Aspergillus fumigatus A1163]|uniref:DUF1264 domain protein n=1 Tax=Aspergillus fumigatus (strain CBS 144.89 / FGSC A1163 / CEA10) TaxID=451804 RepID=B0Y1R1_ASPFC|nr:DUF1264 domain protein [Aspergillus fumigatus A1163]